MANTFFWQHRVFKLVKEAGFCLGFLFGGGGEVDHEKNF